MKKIVLGNGWFDARLDVEEVKQYLGLEDVSYQIAKAIKNCMQDNNANSIFLTELLKNEDKIFDYVIKSIRDEHARYLKDIMNVSRKKK